MITIKADFEEEVLKNVFDRFGVSFVGEFVEHIKRFQFKAISKDNTKAASLIDVSVSESGNVKFTIQEKYLEQSVIFETQEEDIFWNKPDNIHDEIREEIENETPKIKKIWIRDGKIELKILSTDEIPDGWERGRMFKRSLTSRSK